MSKETQHNYDHYKPAKVIGELRLTKVERELLARSFKQMRNHFKGSLTLAPDQINQGVNAVFALENKLETILFNFEISDAS